MGVKGQGAWRFTFKRGLFYICRTYDTQLPAFDMVPVISRLYGLGILSRYTPKKLSPI